MENQMRNDHQGETLAKTEGNIVVWYASGKQNGRIPGPHVRANGKGGVYARGYYWHAKEEKLVAGPFTTRLKAAKAARDASLARYLKQLEAKAEHPDVPASADYFNRES